MRCGRGQLRLAEKRGTSRNARDACVRSDPVGAEMEPRKCRKSEIRVVGVAVGCMHACTLYLRGESVRGFNGAGAAGLHPSLGAH